MERPTKKPCSFFEEYQRMALLQNAFPLPYIMAHKEDNALYLNADRVRDNEWKSILTALRKDSTLKYITITSAWQKPSNNGKNIYHFNITFDFLKESFEKSSFDITWATLFCKVSIALKCLLKNKLLIRISEKDRRSKKFFYHFADKKMIRNFLGKIWFFNNLVVNFVQVRRSAVHRRKSYRSERGLWIRNFQGLFLRCHEFA